MEVQLKHHQGHETILYAVENAIFSTDYVFEYKYEVTKHANVVDVGSIFLFC
jgi:hypothetical protein